MKRFLLQLVKATVTFGLIGYIVQLIDWNAFTLLWPLIDWGWMAVGPLVYLVALSGTAYRWHTMLKGLQIPFSVAHSFIAYLLGTFYNLILPGGLGGDLIRVGYAKKQTKASTTLLASTALMERFFGSMISFQVGAVTLLFLSTQLLTQLGATVVALVIGGALYITGWMLGFFLFWDKISKRLPKGLTRGRLSKKMFSASGEIQRLSWGTRHRIVAGTTCYLICDAFASYALSQGLGLDIPYTVFLLLNPFIYLAMAFPLSLGGLGVREGVVVSFLALLGVHTTEAATLAFLIYLNHAVVGLGGGVMQLTLGLHPRDEAEKIQKEREEHEEEEDPDAPAAP